MKKQILKTITFLGLFFSSNLMATMDGKIDVLIDNLTKIKYENAKDYEGKNIILSINGELFKIKFYTKLSTTIGELHKIHGDIYINNIKQKYFLEQDRYASSLLNLVSCQNENNKTILFLLSAYLDESKAVGEYIQFEHKIFKIDNDIISLDEKNNLFNVPSIYNNTIILNEIKEHEDYPYFNEQRILARLYETNTCDKELTEKANIEVFVNGKWYPQEQSWNIPNIDYVIKSQKQPLYKEPNENTKTKMYLVKNDVVEIMEEKEDWIYILYITKDNKEIKAWIPKKALENKD